MTDRRTNPSPRPRPEGAPAGGPARALLERDDAVLDAVRKDGYDAYAYGAAKGAIPDLRKLEEEGAARNGCWPHLLSDVYASLYKAQPRILDADETDAPAAHRRLIGQVMESIDYDRLRTTTRLSKTGAALGTLELGEDLVAQLPEGEPQVDPDDEADRGWRYLEGCESADDQGRLVRRLVRQSRRRAEEAVETMQALGWGEGQGSGGEADLATATDLSRRLRSDESLRRIARLAGRMRRIALAKRKTRLKRRPDEIVGVETGREITRALPSELAQLGTPLRDLVLLRWAQGDLLQYEVSGQERLAQGPIVVAIDQSGSMSGERDTWAKAVALGLLAIAEREQREFAVVLFDTSTETFHFDGSGGMREVLRCLSTFRGGGTSFEAPLREAMTLIEGAARTRWSAFERADVVMITDGACQLSESFVHSYTARARATGAHTYSIYIGTRKRSLDVVSDGTAYVSDLSRDAEALELAFGF